VALALVAALAISPAGAAVRGWVGDAVGGGGGHEPSQALLTSLPAPGSLLVDSARGPWVVHADGSKRLLGSYSESTWSPHGLYEAATEGGELTALDPIGEVRWSISRPAPVRRPSWSPDGERIAYLSGGDLRVVAGDGTGDRLLMRGVALVAPAWEPGPSRRLTFAEAGGGLRTIEADSGRTVFGLDPGTKVTGLAWSGDGARLLVTAPSQLQVRGPAGSVAWRVQAPPGWSVRAAAISPDGERVAAVLTSASGRQSALDLAGPGGERRRLFAGPGRFDDVLYSPDGRWLLLTWRSADQWLFLNPANPRGLVAISDIAAQFDPGTTAPPSFPSVAGWCCTPAG
jgi:Tol biopolymer transport system component